MKLGIARALLEDAWHQVLDNWVFRLLVILVIVMVAPTFLVSMREDEVVVLFGLFDWSRIRYEDLLPAFNQRTEDFAELNVVAIQALQEIIVEGLAGTIGILLTIAATAFFVPRMLEKGAADTLFSKPVSRTTLLLARYLTGVLFVAVLAAILIGGMHLGFLLCSGYSDPGFLWGAVTLVYVFAVVHAFSVLVAALTRSSVAAILLSAFFFMGTGCVHQLWLMKEYQQAAAADARALAAPDAEPVERERPPALELMLTTLDALHYTLPKTSDAGFLTKMLRRSVTRAPRALRDEEGDVTVETVAADLEPLHEGRELDLSVATAAWVRRSDGVEEVRLELSRRPRDRGPDGEPLERKLNPLSAARALQAELEDREDVVEGPERPRSERPAPPRRPRSPFEPQPRETEPVEAGADEPDRFADAVVEAVDELYAAQVEWSERRDAATVHRQATFFAVGDWLFRLDATFAADVERPERRALVARHLAEYELASRSANALDPASWYEHRFGLAAPLRFNVLFSIGSTLAFCVLVLGVADLRLRRIDF